MNIKEFVLGKKTKCSFFTDLTIIQCIEQLDRSIIKPKLFRTTFEGRIEGKIKKDTFTLWAVGQRNSWMSLYHGKFENSGRGTQIIGYFDVHLFTKMVVLGGIILILLAIINILMQPELHLDDLLLPVFVGIFFIAVSRIGIWAGEQKQKDIISFIENNLKAKRTNSSL